MAADDIMDGVVEILASFGSGVLIGGLLIGMFGRKYLFSYLNEKGKNLATQEDIENITNQIEAIKSQYSLLLEEERSRNQLRLAAVERRLQAHQEAYSLWRKLVAHVHNEKIGDVVIECQSWWDKNCLYLSPSSRDAFRAAYDSAFNHKEILQNRLNADLVEANFSKIINAGAKIVEDVHLPNLGDAESKVIEDKNS